MNPVVIPWVQFVGLGVVIGVAGYQLSSLGDMIAEKTGLGRNWIGLILLSTITSLPELMTGISSVGLTSAPDLAVGDVLGSCVFNLTLVFLLDLLYRDESVYCKITQGHLLSGTLNVVLLSYLGLALTVRGQFLDLRVAHVGVATALIPVFYLLALRTLFVFERRRNLATVEVHQDPPLSPVQVYGGFVLAASVVILAGAALPFVAHSLMKEMGWNETFVGTLFVAFATSLPEISVTISTVRLGVIELGLSNLLGSNLFNVVILAIDDLFYKKGPLLRDVSSAHATTAFSATMMTGLVLAALILQPRRRILNTVSMISLLLLIIYFFNAYLLYQRSV